MKTRIAVAGSSYRKPEVFGIIQSSGRVLNTLRERKLKFPTMAVIIIGHLWPVISLACIITAFIYGGL